MRPLPGRKRAPMKGDPGTKRVLFICLGNICRSPAAEIIFRRQVREAGRTAEFEIDSAGTGGYHIGAPPDSRMSAVLKKRGYTVAGSARKLTAADLEYYDLVVPMDQENLSDTRRLDPGGTHRAKIRPLTGFCTRHTDREVPDPYYDGGFDHVADLLEDGCQGVLASFPPSPASR